jgi:polyphosphate glucokinase
LECAADVSWAAGHRELTVNVLVVDIGGTSVKILATGQEASRRFLSGRRLTPGAMVEQVGKLATGWKFEAVALGYPGVVANGVPAFEPRNLAAGWVGFDYRSAFACPVRIMNDAAMQALGSYRGGVMFFLGLGTGLGSAIVANHAVIPMELGRLSYRDGTYEDYLGASALKRLGVVKWREHVVLIVDRLVAGFFADEIVLGGGNARRLVDPPPKCRIGDNANAFIGGFRMWERDHAWAARRSKVWAPPPGSTYSRVLKPNLMGAARGSRP